jgi:hypothetical protein
MTQLRWYFQNRGLVMSKDWQARRFVSVALDDELVHDLVAVAIVHDLVFTAAVAEAIADYVAARRDHPEFQIERNKPLRLRWLLDERSSHAG